MSEKIRVADFLLKRLHDKYGVKYISLITGNGALVLNDALAKIKDKITPVIALYLVDNKENKFPHLFYNYYNK